jgi:hypothetical protein
MGMIEMMRIAIETALAIYVTYLCIKEAVSLFKEMR